MDFDSIIEILHLEEIATIRKLKDSLKQLIADHLHFLPE